MIDLLEIRDKTDIQEIKKILISEEDGTFEIYVPKSTGIFSDPDAVGEDYALLAFAGQELKDIAQEFSYKVVPPTEHESVLFTVEGVELDKLANTLLELSFYYGLNEFEDEDEFTYMDVDQYIADVNDGKIDAACPEFVEFSNEYFERGSEDNDDER